MDLRADRHDKDDVSGTDEQSHRELRQCNLPGGMECVGQVDDQVGMDIWHSSTQCPTCGNIFSSARDWVTAGTIYTGAGIVTVVAAPAFPAVADAYYAVNDYALELEAESPGTIKATADVIRSLLSPMSTTPPSTVSGFTMRAIMWFWMNKPF